MQYVRDFLRCVALGELAGWFNDTSTWPLARGFDVFCRWFDYQHHSMLIDLCDEPLIQERD
jgi:hypothetical protein